MVEPLDVTSIPEGTELVGRYRVTRMLGVGGMGAVAAAQDLRDGRTVAIKLLLPHLVSVADAATRFVREAEAAARIQSDHVARVTDVGTMSEGVPYIVMEHLEGEDLARTIKRGRPLSIPEAIDYAAQAGDALAAAHRAGVIHRDVKPANLFLSRDAAGRPLVKVLDFGISKVSQDAATDVSLTRTSAVLGSGTYMSPEQIRSAKSVDHRTDIYALGVCVFELLCGKRPYQASTFSELCLKVNLDPPEPLQRFRADIPDDLAGVIAKAYEKKADDRYPTIAAFLDALSPWASAETRALIERIPRGDATAATKPLASAPAAVAEASPLAAPARSSSALVLLSVWIALAVATATFVVLQHYVGS